MNQTMNIIGCGRLGKTLGRKLAAVGAVRIGGIVNRSLASSTAAADYIGRGKPTRSLSELPAAEITMIACSDDAIKQCCFEAVEVGAIKAGSIVFHCSGAQSSEVLSSATGAKAHVGSMHPVKSFADLEAAYATLEGTSCGVEGAAKAHKFLCSAANACGMSTFDLDAESKLLYHAGNVTVCNYLVALLEVGFRCFEQAGVDRSQATDIIGPFIDQTLDNVRRSGTAAALTGPIARGDKQLVVDQYAQVRLVDEALGDVYSSLGLIAAQLSTVQGSAQLADIAAIVAALKPGVEPDC